MRSDSNTDYVASHMYECLVVRKNYRHRGQFKSILVDRMNFKNWNTSYIFTLHIFIKLIYASLAFIQLILLNYWLTDYHKEKTLNQILFGHNNWKLTQRFPRMTMCRFNVYIQGYESQKHWLQCTLPINIYIEKLYLIVWFWLWFVLITTSLNIFYTIYMILLPHSRRSFILKRLNNLSNLSENHGDILDQLYNLLKIDGVEVLSLIYTNTNNVHVNNIFQELIKRLKADTHSE